MKSIQHKFALIELSNNFFLVQLTNKEDCEIALLRGTWMIRNHHLHVQRWKSNFVADEAMINTLLVWI